MHQPLNAQQSQLSLSRTALPPIPADHLLPTTFSPRRGASLVEVLVVTGIIAGLAALTLGGISSARKSYTLNKMLSERRDWISSVETVAKTPELEILGFKNQYMSSLADVCKSKYSPDHPEAKMDPDAIELLILLKKIADAKAINPYADTVDLEQKADEKRRVLEKRYFPNLEDPAAK